MHDSDCMICGRPLHYSSHISRHKCAICHRVFVSNVECEAGHFVCDACHSAGSCDFAAVLLSSPEKDPAELFRKLAALPSVHLHGPEHHSIVPCVLLTAYHANGGRLELAPALKEALARSKQVPGGTCGNWGVCGAAAGAGIYASIVTGSNPLNAEVWHIPMLLTLRITEHLATVGGPRCCKRVSLIAIEESVDFTREQFGIDMPCSVRPCTYFSRNRECIRERCPYYPVKK